MAVTSGGAARRLSSVLGVKLGTAHLYGQALRDDGILSKSGRGPSAAVMTPDDISAWLVALMSAETATSAPAVVRQTLSTPVFYPPEQHLRICCAANVREFLRELIAGGPDGWWLSHVDFYVGGGELDAVLRPLDRDKPYGLGEPTVLRFVRSEPDRTGMRWRDADETPLCDRLTINRVAGAGIRKIASLVGDSE